MYRNLVILLAFCLALVTAQNTHAGEPDFGNAYSVLVVGDSLSIPLGERLEEYFKLRPGITFHRLGKVSSGLARPDFFNWETNLKFMVNRHKPDAVFIMIGTNDTKNLTTPAGNTRAFGSKGWSKEYIRRGQRLLDLCRTANPTVSVFWVGAPVMGRKQLDGDVRIVNRTLFRLCAANQNCTYIDTRDVLADGQGKFISHGVAASGERIRLRAKDGVHVTKAGSLLIADRCLEKAIFTSPPAGGQSTRQTESIAKAAQRSAAPRTGAKSKAAVVHASTRRNAAGNWFYSIQESSWVRYEEAQRRVRVLRKRGISARVAKADLGERGVWHRVMIGAFRSLKRARQEKKDLHAIHKLDHALIMKVRGSA